MEPSRLPPLLAMIDDPYRAATSERTTWQSEAERHSEHEPSRWRRTLGIGLGAIAAVAAIGAGVVYFLQSRHYESTDDAFVDGYMTQIAPRIAGPVVALEFSDNQHVSQGQTLVLIDPHDYQVKLDQA